MLRPPPSSMRAAANTPAESVGACVARFPTGGSLPRYQGGSASALWLSRPAQRSLTLRPAWSLSCPGRPVTSECFRQCRYLHHPLRLLPAGATVAGRDSHPLKNGAFHGAPDNPNVMSTYLHKPLLSCLDLIALPSQLCRRGNVALANDHQIGVVRRARMKGACSIMYLLQPSPRGGEAKREGKAPRPVLHKKSCCSAVFCAR